MFISKILNFDRKNYFYWDLPKGYQITQYFNPIAKNGNLQISPTKNITINHFHLEEDTAKTIIDNGEIIIDYNRSGSPLIEIVTDPVFSNGYEVVLFLNKLKQILCFLDISDAKMENGSLRVDVNISLSNTKELGNKVEIKNLN
jgi:aspartyl-tRNA(Asn)/glutamyl-tRNA(Gln) amidotransferase subunit B